MQTRKALDRSHSYDDGAATPWRFGDQDQSHSGSGIWSESKS